MPCSEQIYEPVVGSATVSPSIARREQIEEVRDSALRDKDAVSVSGAEVEERDLNMGSKIMSR